MGAKFQRLIVFIYRSLFLGFAQRVFGLPEQQVAETPAHQQHLQLGQKEADEVLLAKILSYAPTTWATHANSFKEFQKFCDNRGISPFDCVPQTLNVFLLSLASKNFSVSAVENKLKSISFCFRFFMVPDITQDVVIEPIKRFVSKVCPKVTNLKKPFGAVEVRKMWNFIEQKYINLSSVPIVELRSLVLTVTQYHSFCRFADLAVVKLSDVVFDLDYFKIVIQYSKTDQIGEGQEAFVLKSADRLRDPHMLMCLYLQRLDSYDVQDLYLFPPLT
jgi:site-specific recombinase XerD